MLLHIEHKTVYRYARPVHLGPHRLMVRPIEGHDVQIRSSELTIDPSHRTRWIHDVFGNSIALVDFSAPASQLTITSRVVVEQFNTNPFDFVLDPEAVEVPFRYPADETLDVAPYVQPAHPEDQTAIAQWLKPFLGLDGRAKTLDVLTSINKSFPLFFQYSRREELGVQTPGVTLQKRAGSCRDFAFLLADIARNLGVAARFVSGYLCHAVTPSLEPAHNATHAWTECYLPGAGWKGFDPTCGVLAADLHVRTGVARHPTQASPIRGSFAGSPADYLGIDVTVDARADPTVSTSTF